MYLPNLKGQPLALVRGAALAQALAPYRTRWEALPAQVYLLAEEPTPSPLPLLLDPQGLLLPLLPGQGALITDAHLEVYHLGPAWKGEEVLAWLEFVTHQCPECVIPEADWF